MNIPAYAVIAFSLWAAIEILISKFLYIEYRIAISTPILFFAIIYIISETFNGMTMLGKSFLLRSAMITLFAVTAIIARAVRHARKKDKDEH